MEGKRTQESWRWEARHDKTRPTISIIEPGKEGTSRPGRTFGFGRVLDPEDLRDGPLKLEDDQARIDEHVQRERSQRHEVPGDPPEVVLCSYTACVGSEARETGP